MIEIAEIDHVITLAQDRQKAEMPEESSDYLNQLIEALAPDWNWPDTRFAQMRIRTGGLVDWHAVREEMLLAVNSTLVKTLGRHESESRGRNNLNANKRDKAEDRRDEIRQVYRVGMSAGDVENALRQADLGPYPRSTIEKDLRKIRGPKR